MATWRGINHRLQRSWRIERFVYRHHRFFGACILLGAMVFLALLASYHTGIFKTDLRALWGMRGLPLVALLLQAAAWLFALFALLVALFMLLRPSALKPLEAKANRWVDPLAVVIPASSPRLRWIAGGLILVGLVVIVAIIRWIR